MPSANGSVKPTNPKDAVGSDKLPLHLWPTTATAVGCLAMLEGLLKYGRSNFRAVGVRSSIYYDAARRHLDEWFEGQDVDPDSGLPTLGKALACIAVLIDAEAAGKLNDDRMTPGGYHALLADLTPHVKRLKAQHADKTPRHYTIADGAETAHGEQAGDTIHFGSGEAPAPAAACGENVQPVPPGDGGYVVLRPRPGPVGGVQVRAAAEPPDHPGAGLGLACAAAVAG